jgi:hypothetical protein
MQLLSQHAYNAAIIAIYAQTIHIACMATKTISLTIEAYERLRRARRRPNESFSAVVLRARWADDPVVGAEYMRMVRERGPLYTTDELKAVEDAKESDGPPSDKWQTS